AGVPATDGDAVMDRACRRDRLLLPAERRPGRDVAGEQPAPAQVAHDPRVAARQGAAGGLDVAQLSAGPSLCECPRDRRELPVETEPRGRAIERDPQLPAPAGM